MIALKRERKQPVIFRFGLGSSLGFQKKMGTLSLEKPEDMVHHVPRAWGEEEISKFLTDQDWAEVSAVAKKDERLGPFLDFVQLKRPRRILGSSTSRTTVIKRAIE